MIVDESLFFENPEAPLDECRRELPGTQAAPEFLFRSWSIWKKMKGSLTNTPFGVVFLQLREILGGHVHSDVNAGAFDDVQGDLDGLDAL
jgi:hypothetical protein